MHPQKILNFLSHCSTQFLLFGGQLSKRQVRRDIEHNKNPDNPKRECPAMRQQKIQRRVTIQNSKHSFYAIAQTSSQQNSQHKRAQRNLKNSLGENKRFERQRWRKYGGDKNTQKSILLNPVLDFSRFSTRVPMKKCFT